MGITSDEDRLRELGVDQKLTRGWGLLVSRELGHLGAPPSNDAECPSDASCTFTQQNFGVSFSIISIVTGTCSVLSHIGRPRNALALAWPAGLRTTHLALGRRWGEQALTLLPSDPSQTSRQYNLVLTGLDNGRTGGTSKSTHDPVYGSRLTSIRIAFQLGHGLW